MARYRRFKPFVAKATSRRKALKVKYGITPEDYNVLFKQQDGKCKLCGNPPTRKRLAVDHCHATGRVRGLLCTNCNMMLGHAKDNPTTLLNAIPYLAGE